MLAKAQRRPWVLSLFIGLGSACAVAAEPAPPDVSLTPGFEQFLVIPLRIHLLSAPEIPEADCRLTDADVQRILRKVNAIWHFAGIHWGLESVVREPAARQTRFRLARDLDGPGNLGLFRLLVPEENRRFDGLNVYYIHKFPVNGVWMGDDFAIVQDTARLRPVEGGIDEPIPRVTAHELGHALGLPHREDRTNLLASGTTGTRLNAHEVEVARGKALSIRGTMTTGALWERATRAAEEGADATAQRWWTWLSELPGARSEDAKARLELLGGGPRG